MFKASLLKSFLSVVFTLCAWMGYAQPDANFTANTVSGCAPMVINFTDLSTGNPTQWRWDLGNGTISFLKNPSVTYFTPGQYTVKLVVQNANGSDSLTKTGYITIFAQPVVNFTGSPLTGCFPLPVQFSDLSAPGSGTITQWQWDFGDGNSSNLQNPSHTYTAAGNYNLSLRVTNSNGCSKTVTRLQYVQINNGVTANFSNSLPTTCTAPVNINFTNLSIGTGALTYKWNFGDGTTSTLPAPAHNYTTPGTYAVQLIVTNSTGCADTLLKPNAVTIGAVNADFTIPTTACANKPITFTNTSTPLPVSNTWHFGDGTTSTLINPIKTYTTPGTYQVKLVGNFGACRDSSIQTITVLSKPTSSFSATPLVACKTPLTVNFTNTSTNSSSSLWKFGDGSTSTLSNPSHTYTTPGNYSVTLISTNSTGCADTLIRPQLIKIQLPEIEITNLPTQGCGPLPVAFTSTVNTSEPIVSYLWDFGDGTTSTDVNPSKIFPVGVYDIRLIVTTASGCTDTAFVQEGVRVGIRPTANFSATPRNVCAMVPVIFTNLSTGSADYWQWEFGDGSTSNAQNPTHIYEDTGYFDVKLIVSHNGCIDSIKFSEYIHIDPPVAIYSMELDCNASGKREFTDHSIGADTWLWNFGDGNTSTLQNPVHTYTSPGTYVISLTVTNNISGCSYTKTEETLVIIEPADFTANDTIICRNTNVTFTASSPSQNIVSQQWLFGDGGTGAGNIASHVYTVAGTYNVSLLSTDINGCTDTITKVAYIRVNGPTANFGVTSASTCSMNTVPITDSSITDGIHPITSWTWAYGDGIIDTVTAGPFQHSYAAPGVYTISLAVRDTEGCIDSIVKVSALTISQPFAQFEADTLSCPNRPVTFTNLSEGPGLTYLWDFGDGSTSTATNPVHTYLTDGRYTVKLNIVDRFGCTNSIVKNNYITLSTPHSRFTVSDTVGTCPPLVVNFTNNSDNYTTLNWNFGDGTSSQSPNPSHFYSNAGVFHATLTVNGPTGCTAVTSKTIVVRGPQGTFRYGGLSGCDSLTVNFVASTRDRLSFIWDFNDGSTASTSDSIISHTYVTPGAYVPKMILIDAGGCVVPINGIDTIRVNGADVSFDFTTQPLCNSGNVQFNNTTTSNDNITSYTWHFGDGTTSTEVNPNHFYPRTGTYYPKLVVTTSAGCTDSLINMLPVKVVSTPVASITQSPDGCVPLSATFNGNVSAGDTSAMTWHWDFGNGHMSDLQNPPVELYTQAGNYSIKLLVKNSSGCTDTVISPISAFRLPTVLAGNDNVICQGMETTLRASGASTYVWDQTPGLSCYNCASPIARPDSITTFVVTGTSSEGCINSDSIVLDVKMPINIMDSGPDTLCIGRSVRLKAHGAESYSWSPSTGLSSTNISNPVASPSTTTTYRVIGTDDKGCFTDTAYIPVRVYQIPTVNAGADVTINVGQMIDLVPTISPDVTSVIWSPTGSIFRNIYPAITVKPRENTTFKVEVTNDGGCQAVDNITVQVLCNDANVFIPNTFSPNNDGANDVFYPRGNGLFTIKNAKVFNRWGEIVYERNNFQANDINAGWDGTYKGAKLNPDVYVYIIEILCENNTTLPYKGNIALIR